MLRTAFKMESGATWILSQSSSRDAFPTVIGLSGLAGAGKDTIADYMRSVYAAEKMAFADPLKKSVAILLAESVEKFQDRETKEQKHPFWGITRRKIMQDMGDNVRQCFGPDFFIWRLHQQITQCNANLIVVTDVRYNQEADYIKNVMRGKIWKVSGRAHSVKGRAEAEHASEKGLDEKYIDFCVDTSKELADTYEQIDNRFGYF